MIEVNLQKFTTIRKLKRALAKVCFEEPPTADVKMQIIALETRTLLHDEEATSTKLLKNGLSYFLVKM